MSKIGISDTEWQVMKVLWESSPLASLEIVTKVQESNSWKSPTIKTLLNRLVKKGALNYEKLGNRYLYSPAISKDEAMAEEMDSFLKRITEGSIFPLISHSVQSKRKLSNEEVEALRQLLDDQTTEQD